MAINRSMRLVLLAIVAFACSAPAQDAAPSPGDTALTAEAIMARVAANQDRSEALRKEYVYKQHIHVVTHKPKGRMLREESADYDVVPMPDGTRMKVVGTEQ